MKYCRTLWSSCEIIRNLISCMHEYFIVRIFLEPPRQHFRGRCFIEVKTSCFSISDFVQISTEQL